MTVATIERDILAMIRFLAALRDKCTTLPLADRVQDRARQRCRRHGYATYAGQGLGWSITDKGREYLANSLEHNV